MNKKEVKKAINQLGRVKKSIAITQEDKQKIEAIRQKLYIQLETEKQ